MSIKFKIFNIERAPHDPDKEKQIAEAIMKAINTAYAIDNLGPTAAFIGEMYTGGYMGQKDTKGKGSR